MANMDSLYYFSSIDYSFLKQRPQQLFDCWKENYSDRYRSFYVEAFRSAAVMKGPSVDLPGVIAPEIYYTFSKLGLDPLNAVNRHFIKRMIGRKSGGANIAITCNGLMEPSLDRKLFDVICYDHLDSLDVHIGTRNYELTKKLHDKLLVKSDIVFVTADKLKQDIEAEYPDKTVVMVTNGVDCDFFRKNAARTVADYTKGERPVVGYIGAIAEWIDIDLIHEVARLSPEVDYLMIGPVKPSCQEAVASPPENVHYLGRKPYETVPAYLDLFDVAIIPFKQGDICESTDPIKLYEYFSLGKPVVTTTMRQLVRFNDGSLLRMADEPARFAEMVLGFVQLDAPEMKLKREQLARANSWQDKATLMVDAIERHLAKTGR